VFVGKDSEIPVYLISRGVAFSTLNQGSSLNAYDAELCQEKLSMVSVRLTICNYGEIISLHE
jgi:hypothetical protein